MQRDLRLLPALGAETPPGEWGRANLQPQAEPDDIKDTRYRKVDFQAPCRKGMVLGKGEQLAGWGWWGGGGQF